MKLSNIILFIVTSLAATLIVQLPLQAATQSSTLLQNVPHDQYLKHIANELDWQPSGDPNNLCKGYYLQPSIVADIKNPPDINKAPTFINADGPTVFSRHGVSILQKNVIVTQPGRVIKADKAFIYRNKAGKITQIKLVGHVRSREAGKLLVSDYSYLTLYPKKAILINSAYHIYTEDFRYNAWGTAKQGIREPSTIVRLKNATFSTCSPTHPAWQISAGRIVLDKRHNVGRAYNAVLKVHNIPVLYSPYYSFPLSHKRKSGFLTPILGHFKESGYDVGLPYYWNLAPNYDMLTTPEYYTKRGFRLTNYFRYLTPASHGEIYASFLPHDNAFINFRNDTLAEANSTYSAPVFQPYLKELQREKDRNQDYRGQFSMTDENIYSEEWQTRLYLNYVTDPYFFTDLGRFDGDSTTSQLLNLFQAQYDGSHWQFNSYIQYYQTLHIITQVNSPGQALDQYQRLPGLDTVGYYDSVLPHVDLELDANLTNFNYDSILFPNEPIGQRLHLRPGISLPFNFPGGYIKPQIWVDNTSYNVGQTQGAIKGTSQRTIPIIDVDAGLVFNRHFSFLSSDYLQTLEPRFYYLYVPYVGQDQYPNFDTVLLPYYYEQLFSLNAFEGYDRIENANNTSIGVSTNIYDAQTGSKLLTADLGVSYYIDQPKVCLNNNCLIKKQHFSPLVGDISFNPNPHWGFSGSAAWNIEQDTLNNASTSITYRKDGRHILTFGYTFVHESDMSLPIYTAPPAGFSRNTSNINGSAAWAVTSQWSILGYGSYNFSNRRLNSYFVGLQYDTCCWAIRFLTQRTFTKAIPTGNSSFNNQFDTGYYIQFTLKGLGDFGTSGTNQLINSTIPGFARE